MDCLYHFGVFEMVSGSRFDKNGSLWALVWSWKVDCATATGSDEEILFYDFETGQVHAVPSVRQGGRYSTSARASVFVSFTALDDFTRYKSEFFISGRLLASDRLRATSYFCDVPISEIVSTGEPNQKWSSVSADLETIETRPGQTPDLQCLFGPDRVVVPSPPLPHPLPLSMAFSGAYIASLRALFEMDTIRAACERYGLGVTNLIKSLDGNLMRMIGNSCRYGNSEGSVENLFPEWSAKSGMIDDLESELAGQKAYVGRRACRDPTYPRNAGV